ncbi:hypothetical protein BSKO_07823 [Bryopsis sp. KO-2023]|nr:hypothetical protein BSKO_07823 [Bryopsis sp. KO-2023]
MAASKAGENVVIKFRVLATESATKVSVTGSAVEIGSWHVHSSVILEETGDVKGGFTSWESNAISLPRARFPLTYRCFVNGHRLSPTARPMLWDVEERICLEPPENGVIECKFIITDETCQSGWVTSAGVGAFQLRISLKKSASSFARLTIPCDEEIEVILREAVPHDPAIPEGKTFAEIGLDSFPIYMLTGTVQIPCLGQSFEALAFRVDVIGKTSKQLIARGFVPHQTFQALEGPILSALMTPDLKSAGWFEASFLVVVACEHPNNGFKSLHRKRWTSSQVGLFYDIGHRGSGASKKDRSLVRENTVLSFQKAASNKAEFVEFDVHVTQDGEVVVHHDFTVKLNLGDEVVPIGIPGLTSRQLQSRDMMVHTIPSQEHRDLMKTQEQTQKKTLKRTRSDVHLKNGSWESQKYPDASALSGEFDDGVEFTGPPIHPSQSEPFAGLESDEGPRLKAVLEAKSREGDSSTDCSISSSSSTASMEHANQNNDNSQTNVFRIADKMATLRQAFQCTPKSLGFNIEVKYPTDAQKAALATRFYSRNFFVDAVLKEVFDEAGDRPIILSSFDPDCATLLSLKQPKYPVCFLTCSGTELYDDPRMNSLEAALTFARSSKLQGVVSESSAVLVNPKKIVDEFHDCGLFLFTWGHLNNHYEHYMAQKNAGVDGIILDDVTRMSKATMKEDSMFKKTMKSPASFGYLDAIESLKDGLGALVKLGTIPFSKS